MRARVRYENGWGLSMKKAIFITARLGSSRLPRKHLYQIEGEYCIEHVIRNAKKSVRADSIILCTTNLEEDTVLCELAEKHKIKYFRGSVLDKLERWNGACKRFNIDFFVTADADDLFCSMELVDKAFEQYEKGQAGFIEGEEDIISGAFTYGINAKALEEVCQIKGTSDTEMMWLYFIESGLFKVETLENVTSEYKRKDIRMTLDYIEDYNFFKTVIEGLYQEGKKEYTFKDILLFLEKNPEVAKINIERNNDWKSNQNQKVSLTYKKGYIPDSLREIAVNYEVIDEIFYYNYFQNQLRERFLFIEKLKKMIDLSEKSFLSIACGVAGEESLLVGNAKELVLLDSSIEQISFIKKIYKEHGLLDTRTKIKFISNTIQNYKPYRDFDVIYASGPADWMHDEKAWYLIPESYSNFFKNYLKEDGILLLRIYGPHAHFVSLKKEQYMMLMVDSLEKIGFKDMQMFLNLQLKTCLFIASKKNMDFYMEVLY